MKSSQGYIDLDKKRKAYESIQLIPAIKSDIKGFGGCPDCFSQVGFWLVLGYRISNFCYKGKIPLIGFLIQFFFMLLTNCDISRKATIGKCFRIYHPIGIFIGPNILIGHNTNILPNVFIAHKNLEDFSYSNPPLIGDNVFIGSGAKIIGKVVVSDNSIIGPNCVVIKDIPSNKIVLPTTSKVISKNFFKSN